MKNNLFIYLFIYLFFIFFILFFYFFILSFLFSANEQQDYTEEEDPLTLLELQQIAVLNEHVRKRQNKEMKKSVQEVKFEALLNDIYNERDYENGEELEFNRNVIIIVWQTSISVKVIHCFNLHLICFIVNSL